MYVHVWTWACWILENVVAVGERIRPFDFPVQLLHMTLWDFQPCHSWQCPSDRRPGAKSWLCQGLTVERPWLTLGGLAISVHFIINGPRNKLSHRVHVVYSHLVNSHFINFTLSIPTLSTSHFVNSHFVTIDQVGIDKVRQSGNWRIGNWQSGINLYTKTVNMVCKPSVHSSYNTMGCETYFSISVCYLSSVYLGIHWQLFRLGVMWSCFKLDCCEFRT